MKIITFILPFLLTIFFIIFKIFFNSVYNFLIAEDSLLEYAQAILYLIAFFISLKILLKFLKLRKILNAFLYFILSLMFLFVSFEEISWGQRILNLDTPNYFLEINVQNEISLHNINKIQPYLHLFYVIVGLYGSIGWIIFHPEVSDLKRIFNYKNILDYVVPKWFLSSYFFMTFLLYYSFQYTEFSPKPIPEFLNWRDQECVEFILSLGFVLFTINILSSINLNRNIVDK